MNPTRKTVVNGVELWRCSNNAEQDNLVVKCSLPWSKDAAEKVKNTIERAFHAGMLGDDWTVKVQRRAGGKLKVFFEADATER